MQEETCLDLAFSEEDEESGKITLIERQVGIKVGDKIIKDGRT